MISCRYLNESVNESVCCVLRDTTQPFVCHDVDVCVSEFGCMCCAACSES